MGRKKKSLDRREKGLDSELVPTDPTINVSSRVSMSPPWVEARTACGSIKSWLPRRGEAHTAAFLHFRTTLIFPSTLQFRCKNGKTLAATFANYYRVGECPNIFLQDLLWSSAWRESLKNLPCFSLSHQLLCSLPIFHAEKRLSPKCLTFENWPRVKTTFRPGPPALPTTKFLGRSTIFYPTICLKIEIYKDPLPS